MAAESNNQAQKTDVQATQPRPVASMTQTASAATSTTAVDSTVADQEKSKQPIDPRNPQTYDEWYPGDGTHDGRPAWWNRVFCCGYGVGCLLCPCGSWNCKQERR